MFANNFSGLTTAILSFAALSQAAGFGAKNNVAVYWGQNSYGQGDGQYAQQRLGSYCGNTNVDIIPIAFVLQMTSGQGNQPVLNIANQAGGCTLFPGTQLLHCPQVAQDIKTCQTQYNKTILLSLGGGTYNEGGFNSTSQANDWANKIWYTFGPKSTSSQYLRPFDDAVVDGFDLDFEMKMNNLNTFASRLRLLMSINKSKPFYLTAAPQCPYPDVADDSVLNGNIAVDAVFVQYYNNYCGLQSYNSSLANQTDFNFQVWDKWAKTGSANKNVKVFLGVPAGPGGGAGYQPVGKLGPIIKYAKQFSSFGGVMMWDMSQAYANNPFLTSVKYLVNQK